MILELWRSLWWLGPTDKSYYVKFQAFISNCNVWSAEPLYALLLFATWITVIVYLPFAWKQILYLELWYIAISQGQLHILA